MAGRGPQTFNKRQKEQRRKEKREEKLARRLERKHKSDTSPESEEPPASSLDVPESMPAGAGEPSNRRDD